MTDKYADLRAALDHRPTGDDWIWANYGPKTIGVGISGGPAYLMVRAGDMIDREGMESIVHALVLSRHHARTLLAARDELRAALESVIEDLDLRARIRGDIDDEGIVTLDISDGILDAAYAALSQGEPK